MNHNKHYFFCGIGGSGMLPLAMILESSGAIVEGSDRSYDQGRTPQKFDFLRAQGIELYPQDGSGLTRANQVLVTSGAVEETVPDVKAAIEVGAERMTRADLLSEIFNSASQSIAVGGTSGKSTTTGMIGWILDQAGKRPTVMNGAVMKNFVREDMPFASALSGDADLFVSEVDESDGSIAKYNPTISVLNNVAEDHKSMEELRQLFTDFVSKAKTAVLNLDNDETRQIYQNLNPDKCLTYSVQTHEGHFCAKHLKPEPDGISFTVADHILEEEYEIKLQMPGEHNVSNALAAIAASTAAGVSLSDAAEALNSFVGIKRRMEVVGTNAGITVIDDFGHNPDKIAATLRTLQAFDGRLLLMFQPHGFGPLRLMKDGFIESFTSGMKAGDVLLMPEPVYYGGTVERTVSSEDIAEGIRQGGKEAHALGDREACGQKLLDFAQAGDRIVIMGARDDTLSIFAEEILNQLK